MLSYAPPRSIPAVDSSVARPLQWGVVPRTPQVFLYFTCDSCSSKKEVKSPFSGRNHLRVHSACRRTLQTKCRGAVRTYTAEEGRRGRKEEGIGESDWPRRSLWCRRCGTAPCPTPGRTPTKSGWKLITKGKKSFSSSFFLLMLFLTTDSVAGVRRGGRWHTNGLTLAYSANSMLISGTGYLVNFTRPTDRWNCPYTQPAYSPKHRVTSVVCSELVNWFKPSRNELLC